MDASKIERGNRFLALRSHPAYNDLVALSQSLVLQAAGTLVDYPGWDKDQIAALKQRAQAAKEFHEQLFGAIVETIKEGISEGQTPERGETRAPGSF